MTTQFWSLIAQASVKLIPILLEVSCVSITDLMANPHLDEETDKLQSNVFTLATQQHREKTNE